MRQMKGRVIGRNGRWEMPCALVERQLLRDGKLGGAIYTHAGKKKRT